jgi:hypothetical protein
MADGDDADYLDPLWHTEQILQAFFVAYVDARGNHPTGAEPECCHHQQHVLDGGRSVVGEIPHVLSAADDDADRCVCEESRDPSRCQLLKDRLLFLLVLEALETLLHLLGDEFGGESAAAAHTSNGTKLLARGFIFDNDEAPGLCVLARGGLARKLRCARLVGVE